MKFLRVFLHLTLLKYPNQITFVDFEWSDTLTYDEWKSDWDLTCDEWEEWEKRFNN